MLRDVSQLQSRIVRVHDARRMIRGEAGDPEDFVLKKYDRKPMLLFTIELRVRE